MLIHLYIYIDIITLIKKEFSWLGYLSFAYTKQMFYDVFICLVNNGGFYNVRCFFPSILTNSDNY